MPCASAPPHVHCLCTACAPPVHRNAMCTTLRARQARPALAAVLEQLHRARRSSPSTRRIARQKSSLDVAACCSGRPARAPLGLGCSAHFGGSASAALQTPESAQRCRYSQRQRSPTLRLSTFSSELYARRPQPLLAGWRDAAERTLLGKKQLVNEQGGHGRVCIHQEGCHERHNGRRSDLIRCIYTEYILHVYTLYVRTAQAL